MFRSLIAKLFGTAPRTPIRNANRTRLNAESLEAREVPATFWWGTGLGSDPTSATTPQNWAYRYATTDDPNTPNVIENEIMISPNLLPGNGADVIVGYNPMGPTTEDGPTYYDCNGFNLATGYVLNSLSIGTVGSVSYNKTFTLATDVKTQSYFQASGFVSQPATTGRDITVTDIFTFVGGTLNSSTSLANVTLDSATGYITPYGEGSVTLGANLRPKDGTNLTIAPGTVNLTNDARFESDASNITIPATTSTTPVLFTTQNPNKPNTFKNGGVYSVAHTQLSQPPLEIDGSELQITNFATVEYKGRVGGANSPSLSLAGANGRVAVENGATLKIEHGFVLSGGKLSTLAKAGQTGSTIEGDVANYGADVVIGDGSTPHAYGWLRVMGKVWFYGGTYRPVVNGGVSQTSDRWYSDDNFTIGQNAKLAPDVLNVPQTGLIRNGLWVVIESINGNVAGQFQQISLPPGYDFTSEFDANPAKKYQLRTPN